MFKFMRFYMVGNTENKFLNLCDRDAGFSFVETLAQIILEFLINSLLLRRAFDKNVLAVRQGDETVRRAFSYFICSDNKTNRIDTLIAPLM